jgi:S1 RNA binding domain
VQKNVAAFGAFVDVGAESDGLVHISQLTDGYVENVGDVVTAGASVEVTVVGTENGKLALSMKSDEDLADPRGGRFSDGALMPHVSVFAPVLPRGGWRACCRLLRRAHALGSASADSKQFMVCRRQACVCCALVLALLCVCLCALVISGLFVNQH